MVLRCSLALGSPAHRGQLGALGRGRLRGEQLPGVHEPRHAVLAARQHKGSCTNGTAAVLPEPALRAWPQCSGFPARGSERPEGVAFTRGHRQKALATALNTLVQETVSEALTHSMSACAPPPPGPNSTVGMPAEEMNAESAQ